MKVKAMLPKGKVDRMTLKELWNVTPSNHIWIEDKEGNTINTYEGEAYGKTAVIENIRVKQTPNHGHVLAVRLKETKKLGAV